MAKVIALMLVVITMSTMLASPVECANKIAGIIPISASAYNFTTMIDTFKDCTANVDTCISNTCSYIRKALDGVVAVALPANKAETLEATSKQATVAASTLNMAKATGETKQVAAVSIVYMIAADAVDAAVPAASLGLTHANDLVTLEKSVVGRAIWLDKTY
uniref:Pectinesterase inhibitor domain-containing protein n=1 Tax=Oryza rufipogon TaxID=4529 RepID=A0A0E0P5J6_ORYRU